MDENYDVRDNWKNGNKGLKDPGRRGRRHPEEPWSEIDEELILVGKGIVMYSSRKIFEIIQKEKEGFEFVQSNS